MVHGQGWNMGNSGDIDMYAQDIANAGYYVVSVNYELAPCGVISGQQCHADDGAGPGWWVTREVQDVEAFVTALRASGQVDPNRIGIVGGSAGATLAALVVLDTNDTDGGWPFWNASVRPACAVLLSAVYDFSDRIPDQGDPHVDASSIRAMENFTQSGSPAPQKQYSVVSQVQPPSDGKPFIPLFMAHSQMDETAPRHQLDDMLCALENAGISNQFYKVDELSGGLHSFHYWGSCIDIDTLPCVTVKQDVIGFLDSYLK